MDSTRYRTLEEYLDVRLATFSWRSFFRGFYPRSKNFDYGSSHQFGFVFENNESKKALNKIFSYFIFISIFSVIKVILRIFSKGRYQYFGVYYSVHVPFLICELKPETLSYVGNNILVSDNSLVTKLKAMMLRKTGAHPAIAAIVLRPVL